MSRHFTKLYDRQVDALANAKLSGLELTVYLEIGKRRIHDDDGYYICRVNPAKVTEVTNAGKKSVFKALKSLCQKTYVSGGAEIPILTKASSLGESVYYDNLFTDAEKDRL